MNDRIYMGIDVGSLSTDGVIIDENENILKWIVLSTGASISKTIEKCKSELLGCPLEIQKHQLCTVSTGYGRKRVDFAKETITEITAHALGARYYFPQAKSVLDIGGQDTKVISLMENGNVKNFLMNDKCAAGTGRFIEVMARILEMDLDEMAGAAVSAESTIQLSNTCTVFIESEIISSIADGVKPDVIAASVFKAIAERILFMLRETGAETPIVLSGGVAKNFAMISALQNVIKGEILVPEEPQITGALGASLYSLRKSCI
jgi:predicted CoA-substrate-specific enzyme activase